MNFRDLFPKKTVVCFSCQRKVKNVNLASIRLKGSDGYIEKKICRECEQMFERNVNGKRE